MNGEPQQPRVSLHHGVRCLTLRYDNISKLRDMGLELFNCPEIWQTFRQYCCRDVCQISKQYDHYNSQYCSFEDSQDLGERHPTAYWKEFKVNRSVPGLIRVNNALPSCTCTSSASMILVDSYMHMCNPLSWIWVMCIHVFALETKLELFIIMFN